MGCSPPSLHLPWPARTATRCCAASSSNSRRRSNAVSLTDLITSHDPAIRDRSLDDACAGLSAKQLVEECDALESFRHRSENLYERVRALFFLAAIHRYHLPALVDRQALIPFHGFEHLLARRFEEAIDVFLAAQESG